MTFCITSIKISVHSKVSECSYIAIYWETVPSLVCTACECWGNVRYQDFLSSHCCAVRHHPYTHTRQCILVGVKLIKS